MAKKASEGTEAWVEKYRHEKNGESQVLGRSFLFRGQESIAHLWIQARKKKGRGQKGETAG
jgi:hypothetical protein